MTIRQLLDACLASIFLWLLAYAGYKAAAFFVAIARWL